jgi:hypothetical protein
MTVQTVLLTWQWDHIGHVEGVELSSDDMVEADVVGALESVYVDQLMINMWHIGG